MGNIVASLKKFLGNKNTVTILAVLAGIVVLWYFYNQRVEQAITTIKIPFALEAIDTTKRIEADNIGTKEITKSTTKDNDIITSAAELEGKFVCVGTSIPKNGFFYKSQICDEKDIPNSILYDMEEGYAAYTLEVNTRDTYANSILPGDYIDIYMSAKSDDGLVIFGKLIESIRVLGVRDTSGRDVFWDSSAGDTALLIFAVPETVEGKDDFFTLLKLTEYISGYSIKLMPVPRGQSYTQNPGETILPSDDLKNFILRNYVQMSS